jgi:glycosyltransferase involved in cell wall biosynthesis
MRAQIESLGLEHRVFVLGACYKTEDYYRACDGFVMSSTYEPLGQTILEAAACGMKLSAFSTKAGVDTATQELGLCNIIHYADELNAESLGKAVVQSLSTISHGTPNWRNRYSWEKLLDRLLG